MHLQKGRLLPPKVVSDDRVERFEVSLVCGAVICALAGFALAESRNFSRLEINSLVK